MALRIQLKPHERALIGGAVIKNGRDRAELWIENEVPILRGTDILSPSAVRTPCERVILALQLAYVEPDRRAEHLDTYRMMVVELLQAAPSFTALVESLEAEVEAGRLYQAIKMARGLRARERELIHVP